MNVVWIALAFLSLDLLAAASTGICSSCLDMPTHRITTNDSIALSCPNVTDGTEATFRLLRYNDEIATVKRNQTATVIEPEGTEFQDQETNRTARFILSRLDVKSTGIYTCNVEKMYPPPYSKSAGTHNLVIVVQAMSQFMSVCLEEKDPVMWMWLTLAMLTTYCVIITAMAARFWHNLQNKQNIQHDYMNMKPRALRKKQGVQHPVRMGSPIVFISCSVFLLQVGVGNGVWSVDSQDASEAAVEDCL
ncbi:hypothetical protein SKAU_G00242290 [Synaphobranchus kaupii]|uniref:Uncharacterized protein n=1 Tax=Synaphobranchus kaupii TaxID=118154 RepID=A0A9Q1F7X3_SYNKA|nr:hypothetical protein SKAU_G00242290 [Synaphobranchus kaupii]